MINLRKTCPMNGPNCNIMLCEYQLRKEYKNFKYIFHSPANHLIVYEKDMIHQEEIAKLQNCLSLGDKVQSIVHIQRIDDTLLIY